VTDRAASRRLAGEDDFALGQITVSPSTGRVIAQGREVRVEALTMAVLVTLARTGGATVTRDTLVEACWQGRVVTDDAVARAIAKVRTLERCTTPAPFTLETLPKIGYRLLANRQSEGAALGASKAWFVWSPRVVALLSAAVVVGVVLVAAARVTDARAPAGRLHQPGEAGAGGPVRVADFRDALLVLDERRLRDDLRRGWNPNWKLDSEGNAALHTLMEVCERNPTHDRDGVARVARILVGAGADLAARNKWGDTPLVIAATPRYCGPNHPVVSYLRAAAPALSASRVPAG